MVQVTPSGFEPDLVETVDLDSDGILDLVAIVNDADETLSLLAYFGSGDGTFARVVSDLDIAGSIFHDLGLSAGDFNGDGLPELVASVYGRGIDGEPGLAVLRMRDTGGMYERTQFFELGQKTGRPVLTDLNGDRVLDAAVLIEYSSHGLLVLPGDCR